MSASLGDSQLLLETIDGQQLFVRQNLPVAPAAVLVIVHGLGGASRLLRLYDQLFRSSPRCRLSL